MNKITTVPLNYMKRPTIEESVEEQARVMLHVCHELFHRGLFPRTVTRTSNPPIRPRHSFQVP